MVRPIRLSLAALLALACGIVLSCAGSPPRQPTQAQVQQAPVPPVPFNPAAVTAEKKNATFTDIRTFIEGLDQIVRNQDYAAWTAHLTDAYIAYYSSPSTLYDLSQYPIIKSRGIELKTLKDYFLQVVYPSHQNDKVDDIDFISENLVKAITINPKGDRNILYVLEKQGDTWKIGIGR